VNLVRRVSDKIDVMLIVISLKIHFPGSLLDNAQAQPIIVSIGQAASESQPKLLV
jgi:hypothetical protein